MSLPVTYKNLSALSPLYFNDPDGKLDFINEDKFTLDGLNLLTYNINKKANDNFLKNYTVNNLIKSDTSSNLVNYKRKKNKIDLNSTLNFKSTQSELSSLFFLQVLTSQDDKDSQVTFNIDAIDVNGGKFLIDFIDEEFCTVSFFDGKLPKYMFDTGAEALIFRYLSPTTLALTGNYYFNYFYDNVNHKLRFYKDNKIVSTIITGLTSNVEIISTGPPLFEAVLRTVVLSSEMNSIGLLETNEDSIKNGTINADNELLFVNANNIDQFVYYDTSDNYKLSNDTISGVNYDFVTYYTYSNILTGDKNYADLNFFNLKNHISNSNITYAGLLENKDSDKEYRGREYHNFTNKKGIEKDYDNVSLNYTFFDKEYKIGSKDFTTITMPDNLFPFKKININDTHLAKDGSFAGDNPYFSDKIFKLSDTNRNNLQQSFIEDEEFIVDQNDISLILLQNKEIFGLQTLNTVEKNDVFGDYLCTWLKGDGVEEGVWFDRYYLPGENSFTLPVSGGLNIFNSTTDAAAYFKDHETSLVYYDLKSNMTFEPSASYIYQRINKKQINNYIDSQKDKLLKDTFSIQTSSVQLQDEDTVVLDANKGYDNLDIKSIPNKDFNIGFELELESLSSLNSYQLFGNLYEDGFSIKNNFYFTPFIFIFQDNEVHIYDNNFKLLRINTYEGTANILDILYLEQNNNIVLICDNKIIKTNYFGEILDERYPTTDGFTSDLILEIIKSYKSKTYHGYNNVFFITNKYHQENFIINLDLNNLVPTEVTYLQNQYLQDPLSATYSSIVPLSSTSDKDFRFLVGKEPVKLNDTVSCALQNEQRFIAKQLIPGFAFINEFGENVLPELSSGITYGQTLDEDYFSVVQAVTGAVTSDNLLYFDFIQEGRARIVFDNTNLADNEDPILDSLKSNISDINGADGRLFVQFIDAPLSAIQAGGVVGKGVVQEFTSERFKLSAHKLSDTVSSGYKIDFIEEDKQLKIMSFARDLSSNIVVDKINADTGILENTYTLPITGVDTSVQRVYTAKVAVPGSSFLPSNSLSAKFADGLYKYQRITAQDYVTIGTDTAINQSATFLSLSGNHTHFNPINYYAVDQKYRDFKDKLSFKFNLNTLLDIDVLTETWERAGPPIASTGHASFTWDYPALNLSGWDGEFTTRTSGEVANVEMLFTVPNLSIKNYININFELNSGKISLYNNGVNFGTITFNPNAIPIDRIIYPELFINTQNIRNIPIDEIVKDFSYNSTGGTIKNLKIHNTSFDQSLINYLELQNKSIDPLYFRVPTGTRNQNEEIDSLFTYNIPGNASNYVKVNIMDLGINNDIKQQLESYLTSTVKVVTPSQQKLIYNID